MEAEKDIAIIGGGPAGLSTALHLNQFFPHLTSRILILEKEHYPRPKLCAGGLVNDGEIILQRLGLDVTEIPHVNVESAHFDFMGRGLNIRLPNGFAFRVIRRDEFDAWLAQKAKERGIEIREGIAVKSVKPDKDGVTIVMDHGNFRAQVVVGADGSNGVTRRSVLPNDPVFTARTLEILTSTHRENPIHKTKHAYFDFFPVPDNIAGYVWDFPTQVNGESMRCWGIYDANILSAYTRPPLKESLSSEMTKHGLDLNQCEIKSHPIRLFDPFHEFSAPRVLFVGDAAGVDPIFGEGISMALGYGRVAAREIGKSFQRNEFSFRRFRFEVMKDALGQVLFMRWTLAYVIYSFNWKWFQFLLWRVFKPIVVLVAWLFVINWGRRAR